MSFGAEMKDFMSGFQTGFSMRDKAKDRAFKEKLYNARARGMTTEDTEAFDKTKFGEGSTAITPPEGTSGGKAWQTDDPVDTTLPGEARAFLNVIAGPESGGKYNVRYTPKGGATFEMTGEHPGVHEPGPEGPSTAAGRYQFTKTTWDRLTGGKLPFTPENQDRMAWKLAQDDYTSRTKRDLLTDLKAGGPTVGILSALSPTWAGFKGNITKRAQKTYADSLSRFSAPAATAVAGSPPTTALPMRTVSLTNDEGAADYADSVVDEEEEGEGYAEGGPVKDSYGRAYTQELAGVDPARPAGPNFNYRTTQATAIPNPSAGVGAKWDAMVAASKARAEAAAKQDVPAAIGPTAYQDAAHRWSEIMAPRREQPQVFTSNAPGRNWSPQESRAYNRMLAGPAPTPAFMTESDYALYQQGKGSDPLQQQYYDMVQPGGYKAGNRRPGAMRFAEGGMVPESGFSYASGGMVNPEDYRTLDPGNRETIREGTSALWRIEGNLGARQKAAQQRLAERDQTYHTVSLPAATTKTSTTKTKTKKDKSEHEAATGMTTPSTPEGPAPGTPGAGKPGELGTAIPPPPATLPATDAMGSVTGGEEPTYAPYGSAPGAALPAAPPPPVVEGRGEHPSENLMPGQSPALFRPSPPSAEAVSPQPPGVTAPPAVGPGTAPVAPNQPRDAYAPPSIPAPAAQAIPAPAAPPEPVVEGRGERPGENIAYAGAQPTMQDTNAEPWIPQNVPEEARGAAAQAWEAGRHLASTGGEPAKQQFLQALQAARSAGVPNSVIEAYADNFGVSAPPRSALKFASGGMVPDDEEEYTPANQRAAASDQPVIPAGGGNLRAATPAAEAKAKGKPLVDKKDLQESTHAALQYLNASVSPQRSTAVGPDPAQGDAQQKFDTNDHALTDDEMTAVTQQVDPENVLSRSQKVMKAQQDMFDFYMARGYPYKAAAAAASVLMYGRRVSQSAGTMAQAALQSGRPDGIDKAVGLIKYAYENMPDGKILKADPAQNGVVHYQLIDEDSGQVESEGDANADQLNQMAQSMTSGLGWAREAMRVAQGGGLTKGGKGTGGYARERDQNKSSLASSVTEAGKALKANPSPEAQAAYDQAKAAALSGGVSQGTITGFDKLYSPKSSEPKTAGERETAAANQALEGRIKQLDEQIASEQDPAKLNSLKKERKAAPLDAAFNHAAAKSKRTLGKEDDEITTALDDAEVAEGRDRDLITRFSKEFARGNNVTGQRAVEAVRRAMDPNEEFGTEGGNVLISGESFLMPGKMWRAIMALRAQAGQTAQAQPAQAGAP